MGVHPYFLPQVTRPTLDKVRFLFGDVSPLRDILWAWQKPR